MISISRIRIFPNLTCRNGSPKAPPKAGMPPEFVEPLEPLPFAVGLKMAENWLRGKLILLVNKPGNKLTFGL